MQQQFQGFHFVLVRDGIARVVHEDSFDEIHGLESSGWTLVWDSARSKEHGFAYAAKIHRCLDPGYTDNDRPIPMKEAKTLYRSISLPGLADIFASGVVSGRMNTFNEFDRRRFVFFGDRITSNLLWQGEDVERQAITALEKEPVNLEFAQIVKSAQDVAACFQKVLQAELDDINEKRRKQGGAPITLDEQELAKMQNGSPLSAGILMQAVGWQNAELEGLKRCLQAFQARMAELRRVYQSMERDWMKAENENRERYPFTSAVIETVPLSHGYHYSKAHGVSNFGDDDEFGFHTDSVTLDDIVRVHCVQKGEIIRTVEAVDFPELAREVEQALNPESTFAMSA